MLGRTQREVGPKEVWKQLAWSCSAAARAGRGVLGHPLQQVGPGGGWFGKVVV